MFTGIVEALGKITKLEKEKDNLTLTLEAPFVSELKINQSIAHNGACLTVTAKNEKTYTVTAVKETLQKTNLGSVKKGDWINLERCMIAGERLDGHIVQGHIDQTATCTNIRTLNGSWEFEFEYTPAPGNTTVPKGSVCINGVSLTVVNSTNNSFSVVIIPYTFEHTNFKFMEKGDRVNVEFDIVGKYIEALAKNVNR